MPRQILRLTGRLLLPALLLLTAACGFEPLYGQRGESGDSIVNDFAETKVATIPERIGQVMRNELLDRINPAGEPAKPRYELRVRLREEVREILVRRDEVATANDLTVTADYELLELPSRKSLNKGTTRSIVRYDVLRSAYATVASAEDARRRAATQLAEDIRTRIGIYFDRARSQAR